MLINTVLDDTYVQLKAIYVAETLKRQRHPGLGAFVDRLLDEQL